MSELDALKKDLDELRFICKKILQVYRIRLMCLNRRHQLLVSIDHNFGNISNVPNFYGTLENCLRRERKVLDIARREETQAGSNIKYAAEKLVGYMEKYRGANKDIKLGGDKKLSRGDMLVFLTHMIKFLKLMEKDMEKIEVRLAKEELFLRGGNRNLEYFNDFISAWDDEMKANLRLIMHVKEVLKANKKVINVGAEQGNRVFTVGLVGATAGGAGASMIALMSNRPDLAPIAVVSVFLPVTLIGFALQFASLCNEELVDVIKDEKLLSQFEEVRKIKKPFWKKLF